MFQFVIICNKACNKLDFFLSHSYFLEGLRADYQVTVVCWEEAAGLGFVLHHLGGFAKCG